ncbi:MAG: hypothetical protein IPJ06_18070 [Saprospiraceae bacterium]|nr:hypothetical protein [Saprospiraceae bacterium]
MSNNPYLPILADFEIVPQGEQQFDEGEVLDMLTRQIAWMLETKTEYLFSLLYRLDVDERLVRRAMDPTAENPLQKVWRVSFSIARWHASRLNGMFVSTTLIRI